MRAEIEWESHEDCTPRTLSGKTLRDMKLGVLQVNETLSAHSDLDPSCPWKESIV